MLDNQLRDTEFPIREAAAGDEEAFARIMHRMMPLLNSLVRQFRFAGIEDEDLAQEALLGLLVAVRSFRPDGGASFITYVTTCVRHRLITVARLHSRTLCEQPLEEDDELPDTAGDPAMRLQAQEEATSLLQHLRQRLTPLEYSVLLLRLSDLSYEGIASRLQISKKAVDNAVQRLRRKLTPPL